MTTLFVALFAALLAGVVGLGVGFTLGSGSLKKIIAAMTPDERYCFNRALDRQRFESKS